MMVAHRRSYYYWREFDTNIGHSIIHDGANFTHRHKCIFLSEIPEGTFTSMDCWSIDKKFLPLCV